jgi:hypothetical protein
VSNGATVGSSGTADDEVIRPPSPPHWTGR